MSGVCILFGHKYETYRGAGQFRDSQFLVCTECGRTVNAGPTDETTAPKDTALRQASQG